MFLRQNMDSSQYDLLDKSTLYGNIALLVSTNISIGSGQVIVLSSNQSPSPSPSPDEDPDEGPDNDRRFGTVRRLFAVYIKSISTYTVILSICYS